MKETNAISLATIKRLPLYMAVLKKQLSAGEKSISSSYVADRLMLDSVQVRKDLAGIGITGQPRIGFPIQEVITQIERVLGWDNVTDSFILGAGNLGTALAGYQGFNDHGLNIVGLFDNNISKVGRVIHGREVLAIDKLADLVRRMHVHIAILTVSSEAAQETADTAVEAGIKAIWNFTPVRLSVPEELIVERVDLAASLAVLSSRVGSVLRQEKEIGDLATKTEISN